MGSEGGEFIFKMDYESLSEVSQHLDEEADQHTEELRRKARLKMERNLELARNVAAQRT